MKIAVVFDSAGTLVKIIRVIKDLKRGKFICNRQTVDIVDEKVGRALVIIKDDPLKTVDVCDDNKLITDFLKEVDIGISYCNPPIDINGIYKDKKAKMKELKEPLEILKKYNIETGYGSALIVDTNEGEIEYTIATAGCLFPEVKDTIKELKNLGVKVFIASGDRREFIEKLAELTGVNKRYILPEAHHKLKKDLIKNLKTDGYFTIMVGDGANDVPAMKESHLAIATLQSGYTSKKAIEAADIKIENIKEVVDIVKKLLEEKNEAKVS
ncbi:haloacid dehalogenase domain-containing protein hydrolase [Methanocaldococcus villosus KIN24-T80]|uniref:Haloacid dehalogenase domain-containing protein hydrolase n=1 Tax=Methanocaldococcus villosus KIN24-T80 TaxID=1069083 RepID=N6V2J8_9EURY|nr:HAD family hydrolase [Methanocaldococcus villosus]ENN96483.1 haloacid dehalogenase domain-containing protein hydrolase [Methanocaldococcus villosus KIN24-T80]